MLPYPLHPVLVADDEPDTREALVAILEALGFATVEQAEDGDEALRRAEARGRLGEPYALIVLDHRMPKVSGLEALPTLLAAFPAVRIVLCSGYERWQIPASVFASGRVGFLQKPMTVEEMELELLRLAVPLSGGVGC